MKIKNMQMQSIARAMRPVLTAIEYAIAVLVVAVSTQFIFGDKTQTWIITVISVSLAVFTSIIWYSDGVDRGEQVASVYNTTLRYYTYTRTIQKMQDFDKLREFCEKKNAEYEQDLLTAKLSEYELTLKNLEDYKEAWKKARESAIRKPKIKIGNILIGKRLHYTDEEFIKLRHRYSSEQVKILETFSNKKIRFEHLETHDITRANVKKKALVPKNTEKQVLPSKIVGKIVWGTILGIFTAAVVFTKKGEWTINETIQVISWAFSISMNIYTSIRSGYKAVTINRYQYYKAKNEICLEYFAFAGKKIEDIEQDLEGKMMTN